MGTRSLTVVETEEWEGKRKEIIVMYRQMDGYPTGHGAELKKFLEPIKMVNGLFPSEQPIANGMGCLAAQLVAHFKEAPGGFYLEPAGTRDCGEEWIYVIYPKKRKGAGPLDGAGDLYIRVYAGCVTFFGAPGTKQEDMPCLYDGPVKDFDPAAVEKKYRDEPQPPHTALDELTAKQAAIKAERAKAAKKWKPPKKATGTDPTMLKSRSKANK